MTTSRWTGRPWLPGLVLAGAFSSGVMFGSAVMALLGALVGACVAAAFPTEHTKFRPRARAVFTWRTILGMPLTHRAARWDFDELEEAELDESGMLWIREDEDTLHPVGRGVTRHDVEDLNRELSAH